MPILIFHFIYRSKIISLKIFPPTNFFVYIRMFQFDFDFCDAYTTCSFLSFLPEIMLTQYYFNFFVLRWLFVSKFLKVCELFFPSQIEFKL